MQTAVAFHKGDKIHSFTYTAQKSGGLWHPQGSPVHVPSLPQGGGVQICETGLSVSGSPYTAC